MAAAMYLNAYSALFVDNYYFFPKQQMKILNEEILGVGKIEWIIQIK